VIYTVCWMVSVDNKGNRKHIKCVCQLLSSSHDLIMCHQQKHVKSRIYQEITGLDNTDNKLDDGCKGGKKIFLLLLRISMPCHAIADPQKKIVWCITSKGCCTTWGWPCDKTQILKYAMHCRYLAIVIEKQ